MTIASQNLIFVCVQRILDQIQNEVGEFRMRERQAGRK